METQSLIELRRLDALEDASDASAHGDYTIVLKQPVVLNEGDSVVLNRSFVDTRGQLGDTISIPEDINVTGKFIIWVCDWAYDKGRYYNTVPFKALRPQAQGFARNNGLGPNQNPGFFVACNPPQLTENTNLLDQCTLIEFAFYVTRNSPKDFPAQYVDFFVSQNPNNPNQQSYTRRFWIPDLTNNTSVNIKCNLLVGQGGQSTQFFFMSIATPLDKLKGGPFGPNDLFVGRVITSASGDVNFKNFVQPPANPNFTPIEFPFSFTIEAKQYTPDELAKLITSKMSADEDDGYSILLEENSAPFLKTSKEVPCFVQVQTSSPPTYDNLTDGRNFFSIDDTDAIYIGAAQTALVYDSDNNTFNFTFLHTPINDTSGNASVIFKLFNDQFAAGFPPREEPKSLFLAHSGIAFTELEPQSFWADTLGVDLSNLVIDNNWQYSPGTIGGSITGAQLPIIDLKPGRNIVTAFAGSDLNLQNSPSALQPDYYLVNTQRKEFINTTVTASIDGLPIPPPTTDTSHYLVEITGVPMSQMVTSKTQTFGLAGVVGRYQTRGSFTEGGGGDGAPTQIRGDSVMLSKLHVRILNPDRTPVTDMGPLSSIYLTVTRQVQLPPPLPPVLAAQPPGLLPPPPQPGQDEPPAKKAK
jgi:hypothetical protein